jgi:hypothetical protein
MILAEFLLYIWLFLNYRSSQRMTASRLKNASVAIEDLLKEYDIRLRPSFGSKLIPNNFHFVFFFI